MGVQVHTVVKDVAASLLYAVGRAEMGRIATEVTIANPKVERVELAESLKESLGAENALFVRMEGELPRADILGVYDAETIILGEVKERDFNHWEDLLKQISGVLNGCGCGMQRERWLLANTWPLRRTSSAGPAPWLGGRRML